MCLIGPVEEHSFMAHIRDVHCPVLRLIKADLPEIKVNPRLTIRDVVRLRIILDGTNKLLVRNLDVLGEKCVASGDKEVLASIACVEIFHFQSELPNLHGFHRAHHTIHRLEILKLCVRNVVDDFDRARRYASKVAVNVHRQLCVAIPWRGVILIKSRDFFNVASDVDLSKGLGREESVERVFHLVLFVNVTVEVVTFALNYEMRDGGNKANNWQLYLMSSSIFL